MMERVSNDAAASLPPLDELLASARVVALPLATRFRGIDVREAVLFEGPEGWTEFSPFTEYDDDEASTWLAAAIDFGWMPQPAPLRSEIPVNATVPAVAAASVPEVLARFDGCRTAKVKVAEPGQRLADDIARVARRARRRSASRAASASTPTAAWNVDEAEHAIHALAEYDLEYAEQPCATVDELAELRRRVKYMGIPIAADESVRKAADPLAVARAGAADLLVIKVQPLGGVRRALDIVAEAGLPAVVSSALDTSVGLVDGRSPSPPRSPSSTTTAGSARHRSSRRMSRRPPLAPRAGVLPVGRVTPDAGPARRARGIRRPRRSGGARASRAATRCWALTPDRAGVSGSGASMMSCADARELGVRAHGTSPRSRGRPSRRAPMRPPRP